jgi:hypothetical protein
MSAKGTFQSATPVQDATPLATDMVASITRSTRPVVLLLPLVQLVSAVAKRSAIPKAKKMATYSMVEPPPMLGARNATIT